MQDASQRRRLVNDDTAAGGTDDPVAVDPLDDEEVEAAFAALEAKRAEWSADYQEERKDFTTQILGGA